MACSPACSCAYKDGTCHFLASSRFGATSASVEADATQSVPRYSLTEDTPKLSRSLVSSFVSCDMPLIPFSSPEHSPAASSILSPPVTSQHSTDNLLSSTAVPWLQNPALPSRYSDGQLQKYGSEHDCNGKASILPPSSYAKSTSYPGQRLVLPAIAEPSAEDCTSDSSVSTAGDATASAPSRWLKTASSGATQAASVEKESYSPTKYQKAATKRTAVRQAEECPTRDSARSLFYPFRSSNTAQATSSSWSSPCEKTVSGVLHSQWTATDSSKEQVTCHSLVETPKICESLESFGTSGRLAKGGIEVRTGSAISSVEYLDDADDGRAWLDHLEKLRGGAPKEEYKRERSRVVDALIRRAATYPKVSGIYFDKHQLRWSVGWAHNGRRAAKYFPVKLFGMREGYDMAVSFKSTKTVPLEPSTPLLPNPVQAAEGPANSVRPSDSSSNGAVLAGVPPSCSENSLSSFTADAPATLSFQPQPATAGAASLCNRTWQEGMKMCPPCFSEIPLAASCPVVTANRQTSSDIKIAEFSGSSKTAVQLVGCSTETVIPPADRLSDSAGSDKEETAGEIHGDHVSAPSSPEPTAHGKLNSLPCARPSHPQWMFPSISEINQPKLPVPCTAPGGRQESQSAVENRLIDSDGGYLSRRQESMPQIPGVLVSAPPLPSLHPHGYVQGRENDTLPRCRNSLELCGVETNMDRDVSVVSAAPRVGSRDSVPAQSGHSAQPSSSVSHQQSSSQETLLSVAPIHLAAHANPGGALDWPRMQSRELHGLSPSQDDAKISDLPSAIKMLGPLCSPLHGVSPCHRTQLAILPTTDNRTEMVPCQQNALKANIQERGLLLGKTVRYDRLRMQHFQQMHHTPGIHFDKHSLRWKATWYDISGHRKAKYFPIARYGFDRARLLAIHTRLTNHIPRGSRYKEKTATEGLTLPVLPQQGSDGIPFGQSSSCVAAADSVPESKTAGNSPLEEHSNTQHQIESSSVLATSNREPSRDGECIHGLLCECKRATGSTTDSSANRQLAALNSLTDGGYDEERDRRLSKASGKRRAEYFPIRHFGFMGARLLAVNARKKMEKFRSQASSGSHTNEKPKREAITKHDLSGVGEGPMGAVESFDCHTTKETEVEDLWNKYVVETLQRRDVSKGHQFSITEGTFFTIGYPRAADEQSGSVVDWVDEDLKASNESPYTEDTEGKTPHNQRRNDPRGLLKAHSETILSLGREAIRFLLCDLRTHCLSGLASGLSPRESIFHMTVLHQHALRVEKAEHCQSLEQYLTIFASCIKHMKLPSHLCQAEQRRLLTSIASLALPPSTNI